MPPLLQRDPDARAPGPENQLAARAPHPPSAIRCLLWQMARHSRKSPRHARELARTMSAPPLPATSGLAASKSATGSSTPVRRRRRCSAPPTDLFEQPVDLEDLNTLRNLSEIDATRTLMETIKAG